MAGETDKMKGRVKEAAGALSDNDELRREGKVDQAAGKVKETVEKGVDKAKDAIKGR
ncbi:MAG: CsbD family protein [Planctomycetota bacterium]|nr:MAG: CsbD family protein [Planctomycetota bacterium]